MLKIHQLVLDNTLCDAHKFVMQYYYIFWTSANPAMFCRTPGVMGNHHLSLVDALAYLIVAEVPSSLPAHLIAGLSSCYRGDSRRVSLL